MHTDIDLDTAFWLRNPNDSAIMIQQNRQVFLQISIRQTSLAIPKDVWRSYESWSDEELKLFVAKHWREWRVSDTEASLQWVIAMKHYLWRRPLDQEFVNKWRDEMGPFWLINVRANAQDWQWVYDNQRRMPLPVLLQLLYFLPPNDVGAAIVVDIPPQLRLVDVDSFSSYLSFEVEFAINMLHKYGSFLLHPQAHFYPRWRALLVCLNYCYLQGRQGHEAHVKNKVREAITAACKLLGVKPSTLLKGYDKQWIDFVLSQKEKPTCLEQWDSLVRKFHNSQKATWQQKLVQRKSAATSENT